MVALSSSLLASSEPASLTEPASSDRPVLAFLVVARPLRCPFSLVGSTWMHFSILALFLLIICIIILFNKKNDI
jgi:uncharacterized protein (DUF983 family)